VNLHGLTGMEGEAEGSSLSAFFANQFDPSLQWQDITWLRNITKLPIIVKGIAHPEDAKLAMKHGAHGIIVSNHGGRQLDVMILYIKCSSLRSVPLRHSPGLCMWFDL
jgi:isopentenyl diphosphate isomerase/L-lactate dehydrogenase-like FMN-dependent dehydrogenase